MGKPPPQTIRITPDVWSGLGRFAEPFESATDVIGRLVDLCTRIASAAKPSETLTDVVDHLLGPPDTASTEADRVHERTQAQRMNATNAAALVLEEEGRAMTAEELYDAMDRKGHWHSDALTPWQTVASCIYTDMKRLGEASRFVKVKRGVFALRANSRSAASS